MFSNWHTKMDRAFAGATCTAIARGGGDIGVIYDYEFSFPAMDMTLKRDMIGLLTTFRGDKKYADGGASIRDVVFYIMRQTGMCTIFVSPKSHRMLVDRLNGMMKEAERVERIAHAAAMREIRQADDRALARMMGEVGMEATVRAPAPAPAPAPASGLAPVVDFWEHARRKGRTVPDLAALAEMNRIGQPY